MKISHSQLESARANPSAFLKALKDASNEYKGRYSRYNTLKLSIYHFHKTNNVTRALHYLRDAEERGFRRHGGKELAAMERQFENYVNDFYALGSAVAQAKRKIEFPLGGDLLITGEIPRLDIVPSGGYLLCLFQKRRLPWQHELRCPLLQHLLALEWNAPASDVTIAMYAFEPHGYEFRQFTKREINDAVTEALSLAKQLS
jgi:hypothetical protein